VILWRGAEEVLNGTFTVGMLVAYLSYQDRFSSSISNLTDHFFSWKMIDIYKERLADILLTKNEEQHEHKSKTNHLDIKNNTTILSVKNLNFNHKGSNHNLMHNISFNINKGEVLAITGKSGCGKSTLIKIILGIFQPTSGLIQTLGLPHTHKDYIQVRKYIGTVLQDDQLFSGSIAENIIFFNDEINHEWMISCAKLALIDNDIIK
ncbi:ATP-binding cassette domain-containing protein, partial [Salmonella enterica]|nr:ATP-binding cassette domain-containing protein [Salmonella enterica]